MIVKPNLGGSGAGMRRFETPGALRQAAVTDAERIVGLNPYGRLVDYLAARGRLREGAGAGVSAARATPSGSSAGATRG